MKVFHDIDEFDLQGEVTAILGNFDGLHLGHQQLIKSGLALGGKVVVVTFEPHPASLKNNEFKRIQTCKEKMRYLELQGVEAVLCLKFNKDFAALGKKDFVENILVRKLKVSNVVIGYNYHFGKGAEGNSADIEQLGEKLGYKAVIIPAFKIRHKVVSSSHIRKFINEGMIKEANEFLGRLFHLEGQVVKGHGVGRKLGFPTANLVVEKSKLLPGPGVYSIIAEVRGSDYKGFCNVGFQPTFNDREEQLVVEVNLFDFDDDIYDEYMDVYFIEYLRKVQKFPSVEELIEELKIDKLRALKSIEENYSTKY